MQTAGRCGDSALVLSEDTLEVLHILFGGRTTVYHIVWQRCLTQCEQLTFELIMRTVVQEAQRTSATRGIVDHLSHHGTTVIEEQFVTDTYLTGRFHEHIPQTHLTVQLPEQEHLDLGIGLLLGAIQTGRKDLGVIEHESVALIKIVQYSPEVEILGRNNIPVGILLCSVDRVTIGIFLKHLYRIRLTVQHHQTTLITMHRGIQRDKLFG